MILIHVIGIQYKSIKVQYKICAVVIISEIIFVGYVDLCARRNEVFHDCSNIIRCGTKIIVHMFMLFSTYLRRGEKEVVVLCLHI